MKKGISQSKVQRMRNLVSGEYGSKTRIRSGYTTKRIVRSEGDVWEERGKTWTIENGIKQTVNKLDKIRIASQTPLCCPKCNSRMKHHQDVHAYKHFKFCNSCLAKFETSLIASGREVWLKYKASVQDANFDYLIKEMTEQYLESINLNKSTVGISEAGDIEDWGGGQSESEIKAYYEAKIKKLVEERNGKS